MPKKKLDAMVENRIERRKEEEKRNKNMVDDIKNSGR